MLLDYQSMLFMQNSTNVMHVAMYIIIYASNLPVHCVECMYLVKAIYDYHPEATISQSGAVSCDEKIIVCYRCGQEGHFARGCA